MAESKDDKGKKPAEKPAAKPASVTPESAAATDGAPEPVDVAELGRAKSVPDWEVAGLMAAAGWAPGKQVDGARFDRALDLFRKRPQGGGPIEV